jgi:zinc/manganese transport system substrate-binding protein
MILSRIFLCFLWVLLSTVAARADEPLRVVASFSVLADIVAQVGGEDVVVTSLIPMGEDPHRWRPAAYEAEILSGADLLVVNGLGLEGWLDELVADAGYNGPVLVASRGIEPLAAPSGEPDPHAWHSLAAARSYGSGIAVTLAGLRPGRAGEIRARLGAFLSELDRLDRWGRKRLEAIPMERRVIVTGHDAFAWLGREFGIGILSPAGLDSFAPLPEERMNELVDEVRAADVGAVFLDAASDPGIARALKERAGVTVGLPLYAGTLSPECSLASSYLAMWQNNFAAITETMKR